MSSSKQYKRPYERLLFPRPEVCPGRTIRCALCGDRIPKGEMVVRVPTYQWYTKYVNVRRAHFKCYDEKVAAIALKEYEKQERVSA